MLDIIYQETNRLRGNKKSKSSENEEDFGRVPTDNIFSNRFLEDLERIWELRHIIPDGPVEMRDLIIKTRHQCHLEESGNIEELGLYLV